MVFPLPGTGKKISDMAKLITPTPLGDFYALVQQGDISHHLANGENPLEGVKIRASIEKASPSLPDGMQVDHCYVLVAKITVEQACNSLVIVWKCANNLFAEGGSDTGERYDAQTWENETCILTLATRDGEYLYSCATKNKWVPTRFHKDGSPHGYLD